jgi:hypothetical protein
MNNKNSFDISEYFNKVFRHRRLFNYVVIPIDSDGSMVQCIVGKDLKKEFPLAYFQRDWKYDESIDPEEFLSKLDEYPDETPGTFLYLDEYEIDDGESHSYLYFDDQGEEQTYRFPIWLIGKFTKEERDKEINPFTMIMPLDDSKIEEIKIEIDIINDLRYENEMIDFEDFQGFEFGLIKLLEKKYLREV